MRRPAAVALFALVLAAAAGAAPARAAAAPRAMRIVYLTGGSAYVDGGALEGLFAGDTLAVRRRGSEIALLRVSDLSSHRAACDTLLTRTALAVGDEVRVVGRAAGAAANPADPAAADSASTASGSGDGDAGLAGSAELESPPAGEARAPRPRPWLRGRAGARWMSASAEGSVRLRQPMLDLRLDGGSESSPVAVGLDVRGRQTLRTSSAGESHRDAEARVYRAAATWRRPDGVASFTAGRLASPALATVSLFDGGLFETGTGRWKAGAFAGTQPEPVHMGWSGRVSEYGAYVEARPIGAPARRWQAGLGAVTSYDGGSSNRDFLFAQGFYRDRRVSGSWLQEADILRPWKRVAGEPGFSLTSTFLSSQLQLAPAFALQGGYDNRRNVRLWRDRVTPETEFDDRYRQGVWAGGVARLDWGLMLAGDRRWNRGSGEDATVTSGTVDLRARRLRALSLRGRWSEFRSDLSESRLMAGSLGVSPTALSRFEVSLGRRTSALAQSTPDAPVRWWGASADLTFGRRWFLDASFEVARGDQERNSQVYAGLSRRL